MLSAFLSILTVRNIVGALEIIGIILLILGIPFAVILIILYSGLRKVDSPALDSQPIYFQAEVSTKNTGQFWVALILLCGGVLLFAVFSLILLWTGTRDGLPVTEGDAQLVLTFGFMALLSLIMVIFISLPWSYPKQKLYLVDKGIMIKTESWRPRFKLLPFESIKAVEYSDTELKVYPRGQEAVEEVFEALKVVSIAADPTKIAFANMTLNPPVLCVRMGKGKSEKFIQELKKHIKV